MTLRNARKCNQCGSEYNARHGHGGSIARTGDAEAFPFNGTTGVQPEHAHWMHGAFCSEECYDWAYYEPPTDY